MIRRLTLNQFRNHQDASLQPGSAFNVLCGSNGAGKTNIMEAISLLVPGRGLRRAPLSEMANDLGAGGFSIAAQIEGDIALGTGTLPDAPERRKTRINGVAATASDLAERLSVIWLTPAMDRLFQEGAGNRRRFFDRLVLALLPSHAKSSSRYEAAMRDRNRLLSDDAPPDPTWLDGLEEQMAEHGAAVSSARHTLLQQLSAQLDAQKEGPFAKPQLALASNELIDQQGLRKILAEGRARDRAAGRTLSGPHRDDLIVTHRAKDRAAAKCSTGEQKALLLSIVLAHAELVAEQRDHRPILLLDEVAAHLDPLRRAALFAHLEAAGGQVWMSGTEAELFEGLPESTKWFTVDDGRVI